MKTVLAMLVILAAAPATAAQATREWPCIQPRQPHLSFGAMWPGPAPDDATRALAREDKALRALADRLAQRRTGTEEATALLADFAAGADAARLTALFEALFARIDADRTALIEGIARYGGGQAALAARIEERREAMARLEAAETPDFDAIDAEEEKLDWDIRIFEERRQMLTAVCESPVLLEQRLFELARMIQAHMPPG